MINPFSRIPTFEQLQGCVAVASAAGGSAVVGSAAVACSTPPAASGCPLRSGTFPSASE